jgi:hypothetical protein
LYLEARAHFERGIRELIGANQGESNIKVVDIKVRFQCHTGLARCGELENDRDEYVLNTIWAIRCYTLVNETTEGIVQGLEWCDGWSDGKGMRWVLEEYDACINSSKAQSFITTISKIVSWDEPEVLRFLERSRLHMETLLLEESKAVLEEAQRVVFLQQDLDTTRLKYWRKDDQGLWKLDVTIWQRH